MTSIQHRLLLWLLASVVLLFGLHWLVTSRFAAHFTEDYVAIRLEHDAEALVSGITFDANGIPDLDPDYVAPIYLRAGSGHYFQVEANGYTLKSGSLGMLDFGIPLEQQPQKTLLRIRGPERQPLLIRVTHYERDGHRFSLAVGEELTGLNRLINRFRLRFAIVSLVLVALLIYAQRIIVRHGLAPLDTVRQATRRLEEGAIERLPEDVPAEVRPLVGEINRLVGLMQQRLVRSRHALGNLAHALKTPLAGLRQHIEQNADRLDAASLQQARTALTLIQSIIDRELKRARLAGPASGGQLCHLNRELPDIIGLLQKVHADKALQFEVELDRDDLRYGDREDMLELLGNLLENAAKWGRQRVRVAASWDAGLVLTVADDGPGIDAALQQALLARGARLDESTSGHGLGLSISREIVDQYGGTLELNRSAVLGGLEVRVFLPGAA
ncbi:MAG: sensor histidine kinase [Gammaproteobacteria bacterium]